MLQRSSLCTFLIHIICEH
ncbi:hypothetical protein Nmel_007359 [Mimus melanotis]